MSKAGRRCGKMCRSAAGWSSLVARRAHNPKAAGSNPAPATRTLRAPIPAAGPSGSPDAAAHWGGRPGPQVSVLLARFLWHNQSMARRNGMGSNQYRVRSIGDAPSLGHESDLMAQAAPDCSPMQDSPSWSDNPSGKDWMRALEQAEREHQGDSAEQVDRLAASSDPTLRVVAGRHPRCSTAQLSCLAADENEMVRAGVASRSDCPPDALSRLAADPHPSVRAMVAGNRQATAEDLMAVVGSAASDPTGKYLPQDGSVRWWSVHRALVHPHFPRHGVDELAQRLLVDENETIRLTATGLLSSQQLQHIAESDPSERMRNAARDVLQHRALLKWQENGHQGPPPQ